MKTDDVKVGKVYLTRIGGQLVRVVVVRQVVRESRGGRGGGWRFAVRREGESRELPKHRSAAALRPAPEPAAKDPVEVAAMVRNASSEEEATKILARASAILVNQPLAAIFGIDLPAGPQRRLLLARELRDRTDHSLEAKLSKAVDQRDDSVLGPLGALARALMRRLIANGGGV